LAVAALAFVPSLAWDKTGHQAIADIAAAHLNPTAQAAVADLLDAKDATTGMSEIADWADRARRSRDGTSHWHYVDIPVTSDGYDAARDCPEDDCIVAQIDKEIAIVKDKTLLKPVRAEALQFLIHFVGDIHQPLHCADNQDKGGTKFTVMAAGRKSNLHAVWDNAVVRAIGSEPDAIAAALSSKISPDVAAQWSTGTPELWANESFQIAKTKIYPQFPGTRSTLAPIVLAEAYPASVGTITATQLAKAGLRLAAILNATLGETAIVAPAEPQPVAAPSN
jgi:beta-galactosidase beta subunit